MFDAAEEGVLVAVGDGAVLLGVAGGGCLAFCDDITGFAGGLLGDQLGMALPPTAGGALITFGVEGLRGVRVALPLGAGCETVRDGVVEPLAPEKICGGVLEGILTNMRCPI